MDARLTLLQDWLPAHVQQAYALQGWGEVGQGSLAAASADASFRRYFRWQDGSHSLIVMDAPPEQEDCGPFVRIAGLLAEAGVRTPRIFAADLQQGFLLLEDMGASTYLQSIREGVSTSQLDAMFDGAIRSLIRWQLSSRPDVLPEYDQAILLRELQLFPDWYVARQLGRDLSATEQADWSELTDLLLTQIQAEPKVFVHRDYMPRNLMTAEGEPGVLDFQDALYGPLSYDATSLFADAFYSWSVDQHQAWLERYWTAAREAGLPVPEALAAFLGQSRLMGVQRHLKVLGIFARICHRDGKPHYLQDAPRFIGYLRQACAVDARLAPLERLLDSLGLQQ